MNTHYQSKDNPNKIFLKPNKGPAIAIRLENGKIKIGALGFTWDKKYLEQNATPITKEKAEVILSNK